MSGQPDGRPGARREPRMPLAWSLVAAGLGNLAIAAILMHSGWLVTGLPVLANAAFTAAFAVWVPVRPVLPLLALAWAAILGAVAGLLLVALLAEAFGPPAV